MDMIRENEARYLKQEQLYNIEIEWESIQPTLIMNLESILLDLYQKYAKIEIEGLMGAVSDVQFSYLRSADQRYPILNEADRNNSVSRLQNKYRYDNRYLEEGDNYIPWYIQMENKRE